MNLPTKLTHPRTARISIVGVLATVTLSLASLNAYADDRSWKDQTKDRPAKQQWGVGDKVYLQKNHHANDDRRPGAVRYDGDRYRHHYGYHQRPYHYGKPRGYIHHHRPHVTKRVVRIHNVHHWRTGRWHHGHHLGHVGWWWVVGNAWYHYASQTYPYPDHTRAVIIVPQAAPVAVAAPAAAPTQYWYYCDSSDTYYPYVSECAEGWQAVPATPNGSAH